MHASRVARVAENLRRMNLKQALISAPASLFYLTGKWIAPGERMVVLYINDQDDTRLYANRLFALRGNIDAELIEYDDTQDCVRILADGLQSGPIGIDKLWPSHFTIRLMEARGDIPRWSAPAAWTTRACARTRRSCNGCAKAPIKTTRPPCRPSRACTPA